MATVLRTPGVYIEEKNAFPNSVVEVPTAVPAFIGYTKRAINGTKSLRDVPFRISSLAEYHTFFGGAPEPRFLINNEKKADPAKPDVKVTPADFIIDGKGYTLDQDKGKFYMYYSMKLFFANGGGPCYIVSVGSYDDNIELGRFENALNNVLVKEEEPTMIVIPDAMWLSDANAYSLQETVLDHCGNRMKSRFAILDVYNGFNSKNDGDPVAAFRSGVSSDFLKYGAAYYPWVNTSIVQDSELSYMNIASRAELKTIMTDEANTLFPDTADGKANDKKKPYTDLIATMPEKDKTDDGKEIETDKTLHQALMVISPTYRNMMIDIKRKLNLLPPSGAIAGIYSRVDNNRGVWKAPANVSVASVVSPAVNLTAEDQEDLNVTLQGKSVNAIRSFIGEGVLVWGARTLDGNSQDWRYINVRRTMIMLEQSIKYAAKAYVFEPNDANTWVSIKSMIINFLTSKWKDGALVGGKPDEAFDVQVGLGSTMTANDILDGIMNITVKVAISRPAEFIVITFQQQMQKS